MKKTFKQVLSESVWASVEQHLLNYYEDAQGKEQLQAYKKLYFELFAVEEEKNEEGMEINVRFYDDREDEDFVQYLIESGEDIEDFEFHSAYHVNGHKLGYDYAFALEFCSHAKWLGFDVNEETCNTYDASEIVAHCLYEISFISFDSEEVEEVWKGLSGEVEEIKKNLPEAPENESGEFEVIVPDGEGNFITWDQVMWRLMGEEGFKKKDKK